MSAISKLPSRAVVAAAVVVKSLGPRGRTRRRLAKRHLRGSGIEIGALHNPLRITADVKYVDRLSRADLRAHYPELAALPLVEPDIIDDGESLQSIGDASQDFIIANHFIEHCEDPIGTLQTFVRRLRPGGVIYMAVPDKRYTFDRERPSTTVEHLEGDHGDGGAASRADHYLEFARIDSIHGRREDDAARGHATQMMHDQFSIHFHVWTTDEFELFLREAAARHFPQLTVLEVARNGDESIFVLRRA
jgi:SAM-dependent methyltransferase